jgi:SAM-dependent methyltransferase
MEAMLAPVDAPLIEALRLDDSASIAEIGSGGGGTTLEIWRRAPLGSVVHGFDISPALIELARTRSAPDERALRFEVADMATEAPEQPYHRLVSRFGVMFFDDPPAAFANLAGWLAPGGRFAFAVWGPLAENPWMTQVSGVARGLIDVPPSDPTAPGPFRYGEADLLLGLLREAGLEELAVSDWRGVLPVGGKLEPADAAEFALASMGPFGELLAEAGSEALQAARQTLTERFSRQYRDGAVWLDACVHLVTGRRSE